MSDVEIPSVDRQINGNIIEAYKGYYEMELQDEYDRVSQAAADDLTISEKELEGLDLEHFINRRVRQIILEHTPKQRLEVYLEWNGILGFTDAIFTISRGEVYAREWY